MAPQPWMFCSPASRGIGLALSRHLLRTTKLPLVATARQDLETTKRRILDGIDGADPERLEVLKVDVLEEDTIAAAAEHCASRFPSTHMHLAFCIPGMLHVEKSPKQLTYDTSLQSFRTNALGPLFLAKHFVPFLPKKAASLPSAAELRAEHLPAAATLSFMYGGVGSVADNAKGGWFSYRASKAAVNQVVKSMDLYLQGVGGRAMAVGLHPGTVKTGLSEGRTGAVPDDLVIEPEEAAERLVSVVGGLQDEHRGRIWDCYGKEIPP